MNDPETSAQQADARGSDADSPDTSPVSIKREDAGIVITWSDDAVSRWSAAQLRSLCPCATCREKKKSAATTETVKSMALPVLSAAEAQPLRIESMRPVGSYAYNIAFSDGHSSGIYPFALLRSP